MPNPVPPLCPRTWSSGILVVVSVAALLLAAVELSAHEFWVVPTSFGIASTLVFGVQSGGGQRR
jgi:hypothetical protein